MNITVVSPWYPHLASPYSGIFVRKCVEAVERLEVHVEVEVPLIYPAPVGPIPPNVLDSIDRLAETDPLRLYETEGNTTWVPAPVPARSGQMGKARAFVDALRRKRRFLPSLADLTHAHLGVPTGWAVRHLEDRPLVITEHQSTLGEILAHGESRSAYRETLAAADAFICVSEFLKSQLVEAFGQMAKDKVEIVPNVVDLGDIGFRVRPRPTFASWLYVGGIMEKKGIKKLLESFADYRARVEPEAVLTLVGEGPMRSWISRFSSSRGIDDAIRLAGARPHDQLGQFFDKADVMVHLSEYETFGIACLEAIGAGLPVVSFRNGGAESTWGDYAELCGILLEPSTPSQGVVEAIRELRDDPGRLDPRAGREMVEQRFSSAVVGKATVEIYQRCLTS